MATPKATRLIKYLSELAKVNATTVRDCQDYAPHLLWLADIPQDRTHCFCRARGAEENVDGDVWLEVKKLQEPPLPAVPKGCLDWVDDAVLRQLDTPPALQAERQVLQERAPGSEEGEPEVFVTLRLADYPQVQEAWARYVDSQWLPWSQAYRHYLGVQKVYATLFGIYQEQQRLGEQYELVMGLGLLSWRQPCGQDVRRHLLVGKAALEFEAARGRFIVRAAPDGDQAAVEMDMLEQTAYPADAGRLQDEGKRLRDNFWERGLVDPLLSAIANSLDAQGRGSYDEALLPSGQRASEVPRVEFAPALLLRKRSLKGLLAILSDMGGQIEAGAPVPAQFRRLCELPVDEGKESAEERKGPAEEMGRAARIPDEIFFPLPANEQQRQIIYKFNAETGVLVQGPPGTGKSLTITNLICHLLATGQRVLVTAKTPRALEVLHEKMPAAIKNLCISMLGSGPEEREALERSVNGILTRFDGYDARRDAKRSEVLLQQLRENRKAKAEEEFALVALRESETFEHNLCGGAYRGTAAAIATRIRSEAEALCWLQDAIHEEMELPLSAAELQEMAALVLMLDRQSVDELNRPFPCPETDIADSAALRELWRRQAAMQASLASGATRRSSSAGQALARAARRDVEALQGALERLTAQMESVARRPLAWIAKAIQEVLQDLDTPYKELHRLTAERLGAVRELAQKIHACSVEIPEGISRKKLAVDARALRTHLVAGGRSKQFFLFEHPVLKKHGPTLRQVLVDGEECLTSATLQKLLDFLTVDQALTDIWALWAGKSIGVPEKHLLMQIAQIDELQEALASVLDLYGLRADVLQAVGRVAGLAMPQAADPAELVELARTCIDVVALADGHLVEAALHTEESRLAEAAGRLNAHPLCEAMLSAFRTRDPERYGQGHEALGLLWQKSAKLRTLRTYLSRLGVKAPELAATLTANLDPAQSVACLRNLPQAWAWRQAQGWVEKLHSQDGASRERNVKRLEDAIRRDLEELGALKSWGHCFSRMNSEHRAHLEGWKLAVGRLGKGTGKYTHTRRAAAQEHLKHCKEVVPAWIMPLHRVYETVEAAPGAFDVIIVDEASQSGFEALPLLYLGKKVIVVGDEKQISPEAVGVDRSHVLALIRTYLSDFAHHDSFDIESSLFEHARIRFGNRITLREHFRCAPEIIRFSNDLSYTSNPLIPLKQCRPDRLTPLQAVHVSGGYREGKGANVINRPEAEAVVEQIVACCADERYAGMTMGVITLQGDTQGSIIEGLLLKALGAEEMQERRILCGNPYCFQGDERDVIFLSMIAARGERIGSLTTEKDRRRFNVAASRAREQMWLFHSVTLNDLSAQCFRQHLLTHFLHTTVRTVAGLEVDGLRQEAAVANRWTEKAPAPFDSWFEVDVALEIAGRGYLVVPQVESAGKRIDLVVQGGSAQLAVECDGDHWHGRDQFEDDMARQRILERCGWTFFRVRESAYRVSPETALTPLWPQLSARGIFPQGMQGPPPAAEASVDADSARLEGPEADVLELDELAALDEEAELDEATVLDEQDESAEGDGARASDGALEFGPGTIQEALALKPGALDEIIIATLRGRPNCSCIRRRLPKYILQKCGIVTRGEPRRLFQRKVEAQVAVMLRSGTLIAYKATNERLKLGYGV